MEKILFTFILMFVVLTINAQDLKTVNVQEAGSLEALLTNSEKKTITNLTLTGNIDARDFRFIRDTLRLLTVLDLSNVNIVTYTGTKGTFVSNLDFTEKNYPANEIPQYSFWNNGSSENTVLKSIILPNSITSIGKFSFAKCKGLTGDLTIPGSVVSVKEYAFGECTGLKGKLTLPNSIISIEDFAFSQCGFTGNLALPNSVTSIGENAFQSCTGFTGDLIIPNSVTSLSGRAFANCYGFKGKLVLSNSTTKIGYGCFISCFYLTGPVIIPNSVKKVERGAFTNCLTITELIIPFSVQSIEDNFISGCTGLKKISTTNPIPLTASSLLFNNFNQNACTLEVPVGSKNAYLQAEGWKNFTSIVEKDFSLRTLGLKIGKNGGILYNEQSCSKDTILTIKKDESFSLKFTPEIGYEIDTLLLNGVSIKSNLINNECIVSLKDHSTLKVTYKLRKLSISIKSAVGATIELFYDYGSIPAFKITTEPNWQIHSISVNGIDVKDFLVNEQFTLAPITENIILNVAFEHTILTTTGNNSDNVKIYGSQSDIVIEGASQNESIHLYTSDGIAVCSMKATGEIIKIPVKTGVVYLVKTRSRTVKVII